MFANATEKMFGEEPIQAFSKKPERSSPRESEKWFDLTPSTNSFHRSGGKTRPSSKTQKNRGFFFPKKRVRSGKTWSASPEKRERQTRSAKSDRVWRVSALRVRSKTRGSF